MDKIRIHSVLSNSKVNGPGERIVIWTQGCSKACKGCFNPETWNPTKGKEYTTEQLYNLIEQMSETNTGITFTGGDPLEQSAPLLDLLQKINSNLLPKLKHGIIVFTGFTMGEIQNSPEESMKECLPLIDLLIDGRYEESLKNNHHLSGSSNQNFHFNCINNRGETLIPRHLIEIDQEVEIHLDEQNDLIQITGFPRIDREFFRIKGLEIK